MTVNQFKTILYQQPFQRFTIRLANGRALPLTQPDFVSLSPMRRSVTVCRPDETFSVLDLLLMTDLHVANGKPA